MPESLRLVVAGAGLFGREHLSRLAQMDGVVIAGIADIHEPAARAAAETFGAGEWATDAVALIQKLQPDGVIVASPGATHVKLARLALGLGIPVLVEKPMAMTVTDARALVEAEATSTGFILPGQVLRFSRPHRQIAAIAHSTAIGRIHAVIARRYRDDSHVARYGDVDPILMTMVHDIDLAVWMSGSIATQATALRSPAGAIRSNTTMLARDARGASWQIGTAWTFPGEACPPDRLEILGEHGSVEFEDGATIRQFGRERREIDLRPEPADDPLRTELDYFVACIRSKTRPELVTSRDALAGLLAAEAALKSLDDGMTVTAGQP